MVTSLVSLDNQRILGCCQGYLRYSGMLSEVTLAFLEPLTQDYFSTHAHKLLLRVNNLQSPSCVCNCGVNI